MKLEHISFSYENERVLDDLSLEIPANKVLALMGKSGAGKTTLLKILAGLLPCEEYREKPRVSCVFQNDRLIPNLTVEKNLLFVAPEADVAGLLQKVGLSEARNKYPRELSGGMARRAATLRAFAYPADLVLLDEPFHNLDVALKYKIMDELSALLRENESTAVLVTHTAEEALYLADEIAVMDGGKIAARFPNGDRAGERLLSILRGERA